MESTFSHIVGNEALKKRLGADIRNGSLAHAYIIEGRKGCGKHTAAKAIAAAVNCTDSQSDTRPCGRCEACRKISEGISPDVITVSRESGKATLGVDAVRSLRADTATVPGELDRKVYIIEDADLLTVQAQNALLLTLEEPPSFVMFLLLCENARSLLETIRSRAPTLRVEPLERNVLDAYLLRNDPRARTVKNNQPEEYAAILTASDGSLGEALRLLDSKERKVFLTERAVTESVIDACTNRTSGNLLSVLLTSFPQKRPEAIAQFCLLETAIRDLIAVSRAEHPHLCFYTDTEKASEKASRFSLSALVALLEAADGAVDALSKNASVPLTLVNFAVAAGC